MLLTVETVIVLVRSFVVISNIFYLMIELIHHIRHVTLLIIHMQLGILFNMLPDITNPDHIYDFLCCVSSYGLASFLLKTCFSTIMTRLKRIVIR